MSHESSDRDLVAAFLTRRDEIAFRDLYRRHTPALYAFALRLTSGRDADAEDLVQDTWIRAAEHLHRFAWHSTLRTWLSGIVVNCWRERVRRLTPDFTLLDEHIAAPPDTGVGLDLDRAIASLPDGYRAVILLHDVEGYTHEEIARLLGVEEGTSKSQLSRARRTLRQWLGGTIRQPLASHT